MLNETISGLNQFQLTDKSPTEKLKNSDEFRETQAATYIYEGETGIKLENSKEFLDLWRRFQDDKTADKLLSSLLTNDDIEGRPNFLVDPNDRLFVFFLEKNFRECLRYLDNLTAIRSAFMGFLTDEEREKVNLVTLDFAAKPARREYNNFIEGRTDKVTGIWNRKSFEAYFNYIKAAHLDKERDNFSGYVFIMLDFDHFKEINDRYGHRSGDKVLKRIGDILLSKGLLRKEDLCFRYGGDEFGVFVPVERKSSTIGSLNNPVDANQIMNRVEEIMTKINAELKETPLSGGKTRDITFSAGITFGLAEDLAHVATLKKTADQALYVAKDMRNAFVIQREFEPRKNQTIKIMNDDGDEGEEIGEENMIPVVIKQVGEKTTVEELSRLF